MNYMTWQKAELTERRYRGPHQTTSVWCTDGVGKPLVVLVHGISGDHAGLVPLAAELSKTYRVAIVELPGHGGSGMIRHPSAMKFQRWFRDVLELIEKDLGHAVFVVAHSFGCSVVLDDHILRTKKVVLLNPVPAPSDMYARYSQLVVRSSHFLAHIYNWRLFILMRSVVLTKVSDKEARRRVRWVGWNSRPKARQIVYQAKLVDMILDETVYGRLPKDAVSLVICAFGDTTARQRDTLHMEDVFGKVPAIFLEGGHLLPIESPGRVAYAIREHMVY